MPVIYEYPHYKLAKDPLSLVLFQVRFSRIRRMPELMPQIQDQLRRNGFPNDVSGVVQHLDLQLSPHGAQLGHPIVQQRDEFRSQDGRWSIIIGEEQLVVMTTNYDRYRGFSERLKRVLEIVDEIAELGLTQIKRIGLRYVDVIVPRPRETFRDYLRAGLRGLHADVFVEDEPFVHAQTVGKTKVGTLNIRVWQNRQGQVYPLDVHDTATQPMPHGIQFEPNQLLTLVDSDHAVQGDWPFNMGDLLETADALHQGVNYTWFKHVVTDHALAAWGATHDTE